jgi:hypothetical protein
MPVRTPVIEVIDDDMAEIMRQKTPAQSLAIANSMWRHARESLIARLRREHPDWTPNRLRAEVQRYLIGSN